MKVEIILDSINPNNHRLTSFVLEYPRYIHAEFCRHRAMSRSVSSSRAIPVDKIIKNVEESNIVPYVWTENKRGMSGDKELSPEKKELALKEWNAAKSSAIGHARKLAEIGLHKQYVNRVIENFGIIKELVTATELENFFALRVDENAQPDIHAIAETMLKLYNESIPRSLGFGEWHIPFGKNIDVIKLHEAIYLSKLDIGIEEATKRVAIARCARISYFNFHGKDDYLSDLELYNKLVGSSPRHLSPTEHIAESVDGENFIGNFRGWKQYRYLFPDQNAKDSRVIKRYYQLLF